MPTIFIFIILFMIKFCTPKINKKYNKAVIGRIANNKDIEKQLSITRIPTPSISLNSAIGGGFPRKRCTLVVGREDSGYVNII